MRTVNKQLKYVWSNVNSIKNTNIWQKIMITRGRGKTHEEEENEVVEEKADD